MQSKDIRPGMLVQALIGYGARDDKDRNFSIYEVLAVGVAENRYAREAVPIGDSGWAAYNIASGTLTNGGGTKILVRPVRYYSGHTGEWTDTATPQIEQAKKYGTLPRADLITPAKVYREWTPEVEAAAIKALADARDAQVRYAAERHEAAKAEAAARNSAAADLEALVGDRVRLPFEFGDVTARADRVTGGQANLTSVQVLAIVQAALDEAAGR